MNNDEMTTQPTIDTLLARLDEWGLRLTNELAQLKDGILELHTGQAELRQNVEELCTGQAELRQNVEELRGGQAELRQNVEELRKGQDELRKGQVELRSDLNAGLRRVERKIEILNDNLLTIKADIRDLEVRLEKVESESLTRT